MTNEMVADILRVESPRDHNPNLVRDMRLILGRSDVLDVVMYLIYTARVYSEYNLQLLSNEHVEVIASMLVDPTPFYNELDRQEQFDELEVWIVLPR